MSTTETTVLNPDHSEQSPALQNNNYPTPTTDGHSVESGSTSSVRSRTNKRYVNWIPFGIFEISASVCSTPVTQPMMQRRPNPTELRLMYLMSKFCVDSKKVSEKFLHRHYPVLKNHPLPLQRMRKIWWRRNFLLTFFGIYIKFGFKNPLILAPCNLVDIAT